MRGIRKQHFHYFSILVICMTDLNKCISSHLVNQLEHDQHSNCNVYRVIHFKKFKPRYRDSFAQETQRGSRVFQVKDLIQSIQNHARQTGVQGVLEKQHSHYFSPCMTGTEY